MTTFHVTIKHLKSLSATLLSHNPTVQLLHLVVYPTVSEGHQLLSSCPLAADGRKGMVLPAAPPPTSACPDSTSLPLAPQASHGPDNASFKQSGCSISIPAGALSTVCLIKSSDGTACPSTWQGIQHSGGAEWISTD